MQIVNGTFTHMQALATHTVCTDAPHPVRDRCLLLHLSLMKFWLVPVIFGAEKFPQKHAETWTPLTAAHISTVLDHQR